MNATKKNIKSISKYCMYSYCLIHCESFDTSYGSFSFGTVKTLAHKPDQLASKIMKVLHQFSVLALSKLRHCFDLVFSFGTVILTLVKFWHCQSFVSVKLNYASFGTVKS